MLIDLNILDFVNILYLYPQPLSATLAQTHTMLQDGHCLHFMNQECRIQSGWVTCFRPHSCAQVSVPLSQFLKPDSSTSTNIQKLCEASGKQECFSPMAHFSSQSVSVDCKGTIAEFKVSYRNLGADWTRGRRANGEQSPSVSREARMDPSSFPETIVTRESEQGRKLLIPERKMSAEPAPFTTITLPEALC
jgi:hypothetical protein